MTLTAPEHLRGGLAKRPKAERQQVHDWIIEQHNAGHYQAAIARALGISQSSVNHVLQKRGIRHIPAGPGRKLDRNGVRVGIAGRALNALEHGAREALIRKSAKTGLPVVDVAFAFWAEHHGAQA